MHVEHETEDQGSFGLRPDSEATCSVKVNVG